MGVVFVLVGFGASAAVARAADSVAPAPFRSAETCRPCHTGIYDEWRQSAMARTAVLAEWSLAMSLDTLEWTGEEEKIRELCYACHAPFARRTGALDLSTSPHREGVSCDYCHSVRAVEASPRINVATVVPGDVKTGPRADAKSTGHETLALPLMGRSEFCAGCHYFAWPGNGMPIDWTYKQWADSPYRAEGVQCQTCHMPRRPGRASNDPSAPMRADVASHRFLGARDLPTLRGALDLRVRRDGETLVVEVENVGAGHSIPGGGGELRELELRVVSGAAASPRTVGRYTIRYLDEDGEPVSGSDESAVRFEDTTIRARETRTERVALASDASARVELWFWYVAEEVADRDGADPESVLVTGRDVPVAGDDSSR